MEFSWSAQEQAFREEVRGFLAANLPPDWSRLAVKSPGSAELTAFSRQFCPRLAEAGLLVPHWPVEHGGGGASAWKHLILGEEMWAVGEPRGPQYYNVNWLGPTIMRFGSEDQKAHHLGLIAGGSVVWCQGFSEPNAGSDLAALRTRADPTPDGYVINGSKIWTSYAALADYCFLLARTGPGRGGITVFLVPMDTPGIEVRHIDSVVGAGDVHEVFFTDVRIPASQRLGEEGQGWAVAGYALHYERAGIPRYALARTALDRIVARLQARSAFADAWVRARAAQCHADCEAARMLFYEVVDRRARDLPPTASTSAARYAVVVAERSVAEFMLDCDPDSMAGAGDQLLETHHKRAITAGIAAGAAEIQLNLIAREIIHKKS